MKKMLSRVLTGLGALALLSLALTLLLGFLRLPGAAAVCFYVFIVPAAVLVLVAVALKIAALCRKIKRTGLFAALLPLLRLFAVDSAVLFALGFLLFRRPYLWESLAGGALVAVASVENGKLRELLRARKKSGHR